MSQPEGGLGGNLRDGRGIRDTRLVERALRERWRIPNRIRKPVIERLAEIVQDTDSSPREVTSAAKAILSASKLNLETIAATIKAGEHEEIEGRIRDLERASQESSNATHVPKVTRTSPTGWTDDMP